MPNINDLKINNRKTQNDTDIGKRLIASAITNNGVSTSSFDSFQTMASKIGSIEGPFLPGTKWISCTSAADNQWRSICFGNGLFVAIANNGTGNRVMTSPDGVNWTIRTSAADNQWNSVCYGNGLFVAVATNGTGNRAMTSPDGVNWTLRSSAADNQWASVCYGNGLFVAVAIDGIDNRVMTSPDGINWTSRASAANFYWYSVCYGNGLFVAVSYDGPAVITSPDGINWTMHGTPTGSGVKWSSVCYGNGLFVAVASLGWTGMLVMTSPDGINWTTRTNAADNSWNSVCYGNGLFVAVASTGTGNRVMTSPDGINWTIRTSAADNTWTSVCYGNGSFVSLAGSGTGNRVMISGISGDLGTYLSAVSNGLDSIATSITAKGVKTTATDFLTTMATNVTNLKVYKEYSTNRFFPGFPTYQSTISIDNFNGLYWIIFMQNGGTSSGIYNVTSNTVSGDYDFTITKEINPGLLSIIFVKDNAGTMDEIIFTFIGY